MSVYCVGVSSLSLPIGFSSYYYSFLFLAYTFFFLTRVAFLSLSAALMQAQRSTFHL